MKNAFLISVLLITICRADESTPSIEASLETIIRSTSAGMYVSGRLGTPGPYALSYPTRDDAKNYFSALNSRVDLQQYMLDKSTPEAIRIAYAISIIQGRIREKKDLKSDSELMQIQLALGARLREIKAAEQGAAANP